MSRTASSNGCSSTFDGRQVAWWIYFSGSSEYSVKVRREILVPFMRSRIEVGQSPTSVRECIRAAIRDTYELRAFSKQEPFWIYKKIFYLNASSALALLRIVQNEAGSSVEITFVPPVIPLTLGLMILMTYITIVNHTGSFLILVLLGFLLVHVICSALFVYEADWIEEQIREALSANDAKE